MRPLPPRHSVDLHRRRKREVRRVAESGEGVQLFEQVRVAQRADAGNRLLEAHSRRGRVGLLGVPRPDGGRSRRLPRVPVHFGMAAVRQTAGLAFVAERAEPDGPVVDVAKSPAGGPEKEPARPALGAVAVFRRKDRRTG